VHEQDLPLGDQRNKLELRHFLEDNRCAIISCAGVNGGDKSGHVAAQIQAIGRASSGMTRALTR
jgi:hypothetical protein